MIQKYEWGSRDQISQDQMFLWPLDRFFFIFHNIKCWACDYLGFHKIKSIF